MKRSVLIVDDDSDLLDVIEQSLIFAGYWVERASDGQQAWEMLATENPSIILSDYTMPRMNGCQLFDLVRASEKNKNTPFIFMSSTPELIHCEGTYSLLRKPFQFEALVSMVNTAMR